MWGYRSLGVCGKGASMSGLGSRWRARVISVGRVRLGRSATDLGAEKPFRYELQQANDVSNEQNLTKVWAVRHLQNRISKFEEPTQFLRIDDSFLI